MTIFLCALTVGTGISVTAQVAGADAPPPGYRSWEVQATAYPQNLDDVIPIRRGYYNDDEDAEGNGFGTDKASGKHGIENTDLLKFLIEEGTVQPAQADDTQFKRRLKHPLLTNQCLGGGVVPVCNVNIAHPMLIVVEVGHFQMYHEGLGSVMLDPNNSGHPAKLPNGDDNPFVDEEAEYIPDGQVLGLVTAYEQNMDGHVSNHVKNWQSSDAFLGIDTA